MTCVSPKHHILWFEISKVCTELGRTEEEESASTVAIKTQAELNCGGEAWVVVQHVPFPIIDYSILYKHHHVCGPLPGSAEIDGWH